MLRTTTDVHDLKQPVITYLLSRLWLFSQSEIGPSLYFILQFKTIKDKSNDVSKSMVVGIFGNDSLDLLTWFLILSGCALVILLVLRWCRKASWPLIKQKAKWQSYTEMGYLNSVSSQKQKSTFETECIRFEMMRFPSVPNNYMKRGRQLAQPNYFQRYPDGSFGHGSHKGNGEAPSNLDPATTPERLRKTKHKKQNHRPTYHSITTLLAETSTQIKSELTSKKNIVHTAIHEASQTSLNLKSKSDHTHTMRNESKHSDIVDESVVAPPKVWFGFRPEPQDIFPQRLKDQLEKIRSSSLDSDNEQFRSALSAPIDLHSAPHSAVQTAQKSAILYPIPDEDISGSHSGSRSND